MAPTSIVFFLLLLSPAAYAATRYDVGGTGGWNTGVNYDDWAGNQKFVVGDSLVFNYDATHSVEEVTENDYKNCNKGSPISTQSNSPTTIALTAVGTRYFICARSNHCEQGMKLEVDVEAAAAGGGGPPSSTPATPGGAPPSTNTPAAAVTPPPAGYNGAASSSRGGVVVGLAIGLVVVLGLRG
ncbi:mavicyanin-like [Andrographis paniculata]|uniref:mavicyanin-like n=1 Tax=Andrographis paniculata TaxID=175694 RepID=UPI0021E85225|nr:mavicyanin-like [Andrographis paniculata]